MSILLGLFETSDPTERPVEDEDLLVFGYACKLYRDDTKALMENSGQLLIPWMGDTSLMVDRYDIRNRLDDKTQFGLKSNIPHKLSPEEEELEELLDSERYLALEADEEGREEAEKRLFENARTDSYGAVGFSYDRLQNAPLQQEHAPIVSQPVCREHPPTSSVDIGEEEDAFLVSEGLTIPEGIRVPATNKLHSIIEKTATFIVRQGAQMEIIIKAKQKFNPFFSFLDYGDALNPYYRHILHMLSTGAYVPRLQQGSADNGSQVQSDERERDPPNIVVEEVDNRKVEESDGKREAGVSADVNDNEDGDSSVEDSDDSDGEGYELHPLLRASLTPKSSKASTPQREPENRSSPVAIEESGSVFHTKTLMMVNAAPSLESETASDQRGTEATANQYPYGSYPSEQQPGHHGYYSGDPYYDAYAYQMQQMHYTQNLQAYYHAMSATHINSMSDATGTSGPTPPPPDLQPIVDKTAQYVAKNDESFETTVLENHCDDPRFSFLNPWDHYHAYYQSKKKEYREKLAQEEAEKENILRQKANLQRLNASGSVSFKLEGKTAKLEGPRVDLSTGDEFMYEDISDEEGQAAEDGADEPPAKRPRLDGEEEQTVEEEVKKMDNKVQEFLSTVKAMFGTD